MPALRKVTTAFILCMLIATACRAQKLLFKNYTVANGLCSNTIWDINQDKQGYMWFGTKYGLNRFDGQEFKCFQHDKDNSKTIGNNFIRKIFYFDDKTFWIGTDEGIYIFDLETQSFRPFKLIGPALINDIQRVKNGEIWIATKEKGIYSYHPKTKKLVNYRHSASEEQSISSNEISTLQEDSEGNIWIGNYGQGIDVYNPAKKIFSHYKADGKAGSLSGNVILTLYAGRDGTMWVGTMAGGLSRWNADSRTFTTFKKTAGNSISDNIVRNIFQPDDNQLYIATEKGLNVYNFASQQFTCYQNKKNDPFSISDNAVYTLFKDREGGIWAGTFFGGINYYSQASSGFEYYYPSGTKNSLNGKAVSAFLEDDSHNLWIGTEDGGLNYYDQTSKNFYSYPFKKGQDALSYPNIHALYRDKKGNIWIGMYTGGLNILNPHTGKIKRYKSDPEDPATLSDNSVYSIDEDRSGTIWVSTISGLNIYNAVTDSFTRVKGKGLDKSCIYQVYEDRENTLWIATYDEGLISMDKRTGTLKQYKAGTGPGALRSNKVISIFDDEQGRLWLGTDGGGLSILNKKTGRFSSFNMAEGARGAVVYGVLKDNEGKLWFSTNSGLYEHNPAKGTLRNYGKWNNLQSQQFNYKAYYKSSSGKLYFGGINGFNAFYPQHVAGERKSPAISFTNFQLFNKDVPVDPAKGLLKKSITYTGHLTLPYNQSVISFEYAALSFTAPQKVEYAFKMEGFDNGWNLVGNQRKATYTNLPPGEYVFKVTEAVNNRISNAQPASIRLTILPPFYKTRLAYLIYTLLIAGLVLWLRKYSEERNFKRNEIKLERLRIKSEQEFYKQKIDFFTAMAHEIRTPLSLILAPLERLLGTEIKPAASREHLEVIEENANRLLELVNQLLDFKRIESDFFEIRVERIDLNGFVHSMYNRFAPIAAQRTIHFLLDGNFKKFEVYADPEALTKILNNLLVNAFKFSRTCVGMRLNDTYVNDQGRRFFSISIEDDGIGIPEDQIDYIFTKFFKVSSKEHQYTNLGGAGMGLALAKSLSEKHGGSLLAQSIEGVKTTFTVYIPLVTRPDTAGDDAPDLPSAAEAEDKQSVLLVEDDPSMIDFLSKSLLAEGYQVIKAHNGQEALNQLEKKGADIIISDVMMPVMDGFELCSKLKADSNYSHLPVILLTAKTNSEAEIQGLESGADAYIPKPFKWKQLALTTRNLLELQGNLKLRFSQQPFAGPDVLPTGNKDKVFLEKLIAAIEQRIADLDLSVEELGKEIGLSRSSLYKKVKSLTGHVPNEFIRLIRLKHAARLLVSNQYSIAQIGYMVGFSSPSYFSKCFYQQFKLTPKEFAERYQEEA